MTVRAKTILIILIAILLGGAGYFFIINRPKPEVLPSVNTAIKTEEIDTSNWQTYRNEKLGFEIKMPKEWSGGYYLGRFIPDDPEFWQEQVGGARFNGPFRVSSSPQFTLRVKDSDLTLEEFARRVGTVSLGDNILVGNLPSKIYKNDKIRKVEGRYHSEDVLIKKGQRYYYFDFSTNYALSTKIDEDIILWNKIISTFKPLD